MPKINIRKIIYIIRHKYLTFNNVVILTAFLIAIGWVGGSLNAMQRNYGLQREIDQKQRQLQLVQLQKESLELEQRYYETDEYKELAAREALGLVMPSEKLLILPDNSEEAKNADKNIASVVVPAAEESSNLEQWLNFLFGGYSKNLNSGNNNDK